MKFWYKSSFLALFFLFVLSVPAVKNLSQGFYTSHDGETHTVRIAQYYLALKDGQMPPRFAPTLYNGFGSPIFVYIYPLPYLFGASIHSLGFSYESSFLILMALGFFLSAVFAYLWLKEVLECEKAAFLGALFYVWIPYRFLLIYVRGSLSEHLSYTFLPLVLFSLTKLSKTPSIFWTAFSSLSLSLVLLTQNLVAFISLPLIVSYLLILHAFTQKKLKFFITYIVVFLWAFAISSITYLPSLFERNFVRFDQSINIAYNNHFVYLSQLLHSPWGYGFDFPGIVNDQLSFQIGIAQIFSAVLFVSVIFFLILSRFFTLTKIKESLFKNIKRKDFLTVVYFFALFLFSIFLVIQIQPNIFLWQHLKILHTIDIPWRFMGLSALSLSFITAYLAKIIRPGFFIIFMTLLVLFANRNHIRINQTRILDDQFFENYTDTATQYGEFTPVWRQSTRVPTDFEKEKRISVLLGNSQITNEKITSKEILFEVNANTQSQLRVNKFYFPNTTLFINDIKLTAFKDFFPSDTKSLHLEGEKDPSGLILFNLPQGSHNVAVYFRETNLRVVANILSLVSVTIALLVIFKNAKI